MLGENGENSGTDGRIWIISVHVAQIDISQKRVDFFKFFRHVQFMIILPTPAK